MACNKPGKALKPKAAMKAYPGPPPNTNRDIFQRQPGNSYPLEPGIHVSLSRNPSQIGKAHRLPIPPSFNGTDTKPYWPANNQAERKQIEEESNTFQVRITLLFVFAMHGARPFIINKVFALL